MIANSPLSTQQADQYTRDGYCIVDDLFSNTEISEIEAFFEVFKTNDQECFDDKRRFDEIDRTQSQVRALHPHRYSEVALGWGLNKNILAVLGEIFQSEPLLAQTMYYYKPPGTCGQAMHQDDFYLMTQPHHCCAAWTAIDDADRENGGLYMVPGSQHDSLKCPEGATAANNFKFGALSKAEMTTKAIPISVKRGQTVFFGGSLIHGSSANRSAKRSRRTFIGHYCSGITDAIAKFYHPVLNQNGETISRIQVAEGGGPCGGEWQGAVH